jgi:hypothetical protein
VTFFARVCRSCRSDPGCPRTRNALTPKFHDSRAILDRWRSYEQTEQLVLLGGVESRWPPSTWLVFETLHAEVGEAISPLADRLDHAAQFVSDLAVVSAFCREQHNP